MCIFQRSIKWISYSYFSWSLFFISSASLSFVWASWSSLNRDVTWRFNISTSFPTCHTGNSKCNYHDDKLTPLWDITRIQLKLVQCWQIFQLSYLKINVLHTILLPQNILTNQFAYALITILSLCKSTLFLVVQESQITADNLSHIFLLTNVSFLFDYFCCMYNFSFGSSIILSNEFYDVWKSP